MKKIIIVALALSAIFVFPVEAKQGHSSKQLASTFIDSLIKNANGGEDSIQSIGITCPIPTLGVNPFKGEIMVRHADWGYGKPIGVLTMTKPTEQPDGALEVIIENTGDEWEGPVLGLDFQFSQPHGTFYITVLKAGSATVQVGVDGRRGVSDEVKCKVVSSEIIRGF